MKKIYFYILFICFLTGLIIIGLRQNRNTSSIRVDKRNFSTTDTASVYQIILENRNLETIKLSRHIKKNTWILNDSIIANQYLIDLLLKTIKEMKIKNPIARSALPNIIQRMAIQNTRLEIFQNKKKPKVIYIGGETPDQLGTYMMLEGAKEPYVIHIPGFNGYLSSRFSCKERLWRDKKIFTNKIVSAKYILNNSMEMTSSYIIAKNIDELHTIHCESFLTSNTQFNTNEIKNRTPFFEIEIINKNGENEILRCIRKKPVNKEKYQDHKYDRERFYGIKDNAIMLIQYKQFENFLISESILDSFMPWKNK